ncbi:hypothetical protein BH10BDE1_BH10BDE1_20790 [soil metagenome]
MSPSSAFPAPEHRQLIAKCLILLIIIVSPVSKSGALVLHFKSQMKPILQIQPISVSTRATSSFMAIVFSVGTLSPSLALAAETVSKQPITKRPVAEKAWGNGLAPISSTAPAVRATAEIPAPIHVFDFRDPGTDELVRFQYQPSSQQELMKFSPSKIRRMETVGVPDKTGFLRSTGKLAMDFPAEYLAFTIAIAISSTIHLDNDPAFALNFVESNTSKEGIVSFAGFVAASRASHSMLQAFGLAYDPRRAALDYRLHAPYTPGELTFAEKVGSDGQKIMVPELGKPRIDAFNTKIIASPMGPTRFQRNFAPLLGPIGLSAGMITSNIIHEVMADQNLRLCAKARYMHPEMPKDPQAAQMMTAAIDEACDKAWEDWTLSKKFADYAPDLFSMSMASFIQAYVLNKGILGGSAWVGKKSFVAGAERAGVTIGENVVSRKLEIQAVKAGSEKVVPWVLRGLRVGGFALGASPWGRFISTIGNIAIFMEIVHPITPMIKQPFERLRQGTDITQRVNAVFFELDRAEKNKWVWQPRAESEFCTGFETDIMGNPTPNMNCRSEEQHEPSFLIKKMAERQAKWREFILADAYLAHKNWQTYVSQFATNYANATTFYHQMFAHINYMRNAPASARKQSYLYEATPLFGLYSDPAKRDAAGARKAVLEAAAWLETYLEGARMKSRSGIPTSAVERENLPFILNGLKALDPAVDIKTLGAVEVAFGKVDAMNEVQRREFESKVRQRLLADAIVRLRKILKEDPRYSDGRMVVSSPTYKRFAETNPFMALRLRLGDPEPLAAGVAFIRQSNDDESVIEQSSKDQHPDRIGRVRTNTMADYLTASMVCGPEADPRFSKEEQIQIYKDRKLTVFESLLDRFGLGTPSAKPTDGDVMIAVSEYIEESTKNDKSWARWFKPGSTGVEWTGFRAEFRPPKVVENVPWWICKDWAKNSNRDSKNLDFDPYDAKWTFNGKNYDGILDVIRQHARVDIVGTQMPPTDPKVAYEDPFDKWWTAKVDKNVIPMVAKFRSNYRSLLKEKYIPALTKNGVDASVEYNKQTLQLGALEALYSETKLYLLILGKTSQVLKDPAARKIYDELSSSILLEFKNMGQLVTDLDFVEQKGVVANASFETKRKALETRLEELQKFVQDRQTATTATEEATKVNAQTLKNLAGLLGEMDSYWGIVRGIQVVSQ